MRIGNVGAGIPVMLKNLLIRLLSRKDKDMMAKLWAIEIMSKETVEEARETYARVPRLLKEKVKDILIEAGMEELTKE